MYIRYCPNCTSNLWHSSKAELNLYACTVCGNVFKIQIVEPKPLKGAKTIKVEGIKNEI